MRKAKEQIQGGGKKEVKEGEASLKVKVPL